MPTEELNLEGLVSLFREYGKITVLRGAVTITTLDFLTPIVVDDITVGLTIGKKKESEFTFLHKNEIESYAEIYSKEGNSLGIFLV